ncbi:unnamed protein product [Mesocestoides corti]|uniref:Receptor ligand binding region domain-containing protein n=1 Tax=Mesocestoides corti TaxID=53468 RepID=A0A0R3U1X1_MESCO|nr:unnamed protein product [Mesocestoides corti]
MNVLIAFIHSALLLFTVSCVYANQGLEIDDSCLSVEERVKWTRSLHFNNQSFSLNIDVNDRPSHWIINYIFEILLRERLGYRDINFIYTPWDSSSTVISRLNCEISRNCSRPPPVHVNLEVWLRTGEEINKHAPPHRVRINGPLGPITRWGLYGSHDALDLLNTARTDPKSHRLHQNQSIDTGVLFYDHPTMFEAYKNLSEDSVYLGLRPERQFTQSLWNITARGSGLDRVALLLSWYPSTLTLNPRLVRLGLPDCAALRARTSINSAVDSSCAFEVNRLVKASWAGLAEAAPLVSQLIDRFQIRQTEYIELLRVVDPSLLNYTDAEQKNQEVKFRSRYREIACRWLRMHRSTWKHWTEGWNVKKEIIIGGMFTFTGTEEFNDLAPNAFHAVDVLNGDEKYFGNSEFAIRLQVRNLTCSQNVVLNDFFNFLTVNPNNESVLGVILALCPDAIEATVRLANLRRVLVISPTVESASFLWRKHYKFFFRTIPSAYTASFIFIRLFQQWRWKRVAMFRKDDHYFYRDAFIANNISLVDDFEVKESMLTYSVALKNVRSVKQRNGRIIIVDHSAAATAIILCAAFHLNMRAEKGYVWFLSPWLSKNFWESPEVVPRECSAGDLKIMHDYSFSVSHPLHTGAVTHSNLMTPMSGFNRSSDASNGGRFFSSRKLRLSKSEMRIRSHQRQLYEQCTFESVIVLGSAIARLLRENPSSLSVLNSPKMAERLRTFVSKTHMEYSNRGYLDKNAVSFFSNNVERLGETLVYRLGVTPPSPPIPPQTPLPSYDEDPPASTVHQLSFDSHNDRLLEAWLLKQIQDKTTVPITLWSFTGPHEGETEYESTPGSDDIHRMHASGGVARSKADAASDWGDDNGEGEDNGGEVNRNDAIAFKTFVDNLIEKPYDKPRWGGGGSTPPTDGSITDADCTFAFISRWFGVSCVVGNWIFAMGVLLIVVVPVVAIVLAYFRRRLQEAEKLTRRPYEELCALLADVNVSYGSFCMSPAFASGGKSLFFVLTSVSVMRLSEPWRLIVSCCQYYWQHRPESMLQVIEEIRANGNCIRPYLTDEPPTLETTAIPFLPGPAACIMPEPPSVPQPAFSAPMGARAWVGGAPFMNPSAPFTDPPSMGDGQRHTAANGSGGGGGGACVVEGHKVSPSANSSASLTSNSSKPCNFPPPITVGQSPPRRVQPPMSVYAPPGPPSYQPLDEFRPLLNPTNRSLSLEFLQKSAFHVHSRPPSFLKGNADENTSDGDEDTEAGDVLSPGRGTSHQCTSCPQKTSLVTRNIPPPTPDAVVGPAGRRHHGNFFARTFAAALDSCSKPHPRRSAGLPSFLRGDQASSMRLRLLPSLRHHQPPPSRNELASKSLPQVCILFTLEVISHCVIKIWTLLRRTLFAS